MPDDLKQAIDAAKQALNPTQVALSRANLAQFLKDEVNVLEGARAQKKEANELKEAATILNQLVENGKTATGDAKKANDSAIAELAKYMTAKDDATPPATPAPGPTGP